MSTTRQIAALQSLQLSSTATPCSTEQDATQFRFKYYDRVTIHTMLTHSQHCTRWQHIVKRYILYGCYHEFGMDFTSYYDDIMMHCLLSTYMSLNVNQLSPKKYLSRPAFHLFWGKHLLMLESTSSSLLLDASILR